MAKAKAKNFPAELLIYQDDTLDDGTPVFSACRNVDEIPENVDGERVGVYILNKAYAFKVRRELK